MLFISANFIEILQLRKSDCYLNYIYSLPNNKITQQNATVLVN
jgi:hypothetical protein